MKVTIVKQPTVSFRLDGCSFNEINMKNMQKTEPKLNDESIGTVLMIQKYWTKTAV